MWVLTNLLNGDSMSKKIILYHDNPRDKDAQNYFENMSFDMFKATTEFFKSSCITRSYQISLQFGW